MRQPVTAVILLAYMVIYVVAAVTVAAMTVTWPRWAQLIFYVVAGVSWIVPLKPLFAWMNRGATPPEED